MPTTACFPILIPSLIPTCAPNQTSFQFRYPVSEPAVGKVDGRVACHDQMHRDDNKQQYELDHVVLCLLDHHLRYSGG